MSLCPTTPTAALMTGANGAARSFAVLMASPGNKHKHKNMFNQEHFYSYQERWEGEVYRHLSLADRPLLDPTFRPKGLAQDL